MANPVAKPARRISSQTNLLSSVTAPFQSPCTSLTCMEKFFFSYSSFGLLPSVAASTLQKWHSILTPIPAPPSGFFVMSSTSHLRSYPDIACVKILFHETVSRMLCSANKLLTRLDTRQERAPASVSCCNSPNPPLDLDPCLSASAYFYSVSRPSPTSAGPASPTSTCDCRP
ncbi:hypothetical protein BO71DRAFT_225832 [Aspergillus ellipticus CBS 707.79]|uniref:Uncharacterized protein n=1 Tax=Aspergillus ellipticus CBS 707.79 TaxID=1448320 RepID=A0A319DBQ6_9EURO|nr:hypothetical protein BO71DRAFT_225832 [Aspergillus ellipticus CBS 707.79]